MTTSSPSTVNSTGLTNSPSTFKPAASLNARIASTKSTQAPPELQAKQRYTAFVANKRPARAGGGGRAMATDVKNHRGRADDAGLAHRKCSGFVNRRSGVQIPHPAPVLNGRAHRSSDDARCPRHRPA